VEIWKLKDVVRLERTTASLVVFAAVRSLGAKVVPNVFLAQLASKRNVFVVVREVQNKKKMPLNTVINK
jgi:hypothetical protein